jgi:SRSO17 transposase
MARSVLAGSLRRDFTPGPCHGRAQEPTKYWLSTLPEDIEFAALVDIAKLRWRIERDYQELKQEVGLGHFEGRGWRVCGASLK